MKSHVFALLVGIALLQVSLAWAEGEEAITIAGDELPSSLNSTATEIDSSVPPPSPKEADGAAQREKETNDPNAKRTDTYEERTLEGKCVRVYQADHGKWNQAVDNCLAKCLDRSPNCNSKCENEATLSFAYSCGWSWGAIAGIIIGVLILAIAGVCLCCYSMKKRGRVAGRPFDNRGQPVAVGPAALPGYANQAPPPYANKPPTAPSAYVNQAPATLPAYAYQAPPAPSVYAN